MVVVRGSGDIHRIRSEEVGEGSADRQDRFDHRMGEEHAVGVGEEEGVRDDVPAEAVVAKGVVVVADGAVAAVADDAARPSPAVSSPATPSRTVVVSWRVTSPTRIKPLG